MPPKAVVVVVAPDWKRTSSDEMVVDGFMMDVDDVLGEVMCVV
jgi:hypothetical protein